MAELRSVSQPGQKYRFPSASRRGEVEKTDHSWLSRGGYLLKTLALPLAAALVLGSAAVALADEDNSTTGSFLGHSFETTTVAVSPDQADAALDEILARGIRLVVIQSNGSDLSRLTDRAAKAGALVFNAIAPDTALRDDQCRDNLLHIAPSNGMQPDAVAQFAVWKNGETGS